MKIQPGRRACRGCGAPIIFVKSQTGKIIPLDPRPVTYNIDKDMTGEEVAIPSNAMISHFLTCPKAGDFSGSKRKV